MNAVPEQIPIEIIQLLTAAEVVEYGLIPYNRFENNINCYGKPGVDYAIATEELEVLYGWSVDVQIIEEDLFNRLYLQYYRNGRAQAAVLGPERVTNVVSGQSFLISLIGEALHDNASDIHIEPYEDRRRIRLRIDGELTERYVISEGQYAPLVNQIKIMANLDIAEKRLPQDGRIGYDHQGEKFDVRVSTLPTNYGEKIVLRLLTRRVELLDLRNLGFSALQYEEYCRAIARPYGMILICGPTGSGKSTTLYATLRQLNKLTANIVTIEDPIEYTLEGVNQVQLKEDIGLTFAAALRTFLRQDPDIIMLGEIRDFATAEMAVRSSLTGHLLFSTIHTNTAWGAVARLADMGVHSYLVADTLIMTVAQRLVRLLCPCCKREVPTSKEVQNLFPEVKIDTYYEAVGCDQCFYTGYFGRRAVYEVIPMDPDLAVAIRMGQSDISSKLSDRGIPSLKEGVIDLFLKGFTSLGEVIPLLNL